MYKEIRLHPNFVKKTSDFIRQLSVCIKHRSSSIKYKANTFDNIGLLL